MDIELSPLAPTWRNGQVEKVAMTKRLDQFLLVEYLLGTVNTCKSWIENVAISAHKPIILPLEKDAHLVKYPFKYFLVWNKDVEFTSLVHSHWKTFYRYR